MKNLRCTVPYVAGMLLLGVGYFWGQSDTDLLRAQPGTVTPASAEKVVADDRVVAYLYGDKPLSRQEFGEYLIARYGKERIRPFVNMKVIDGIAKKHNIVVTEAEIEADIEQTCSKIGVPKKDFVEKVLKDRYGKSIDEWRYDVVKPRLILTHLCREELKLDDEELKKIYENFYGERIQCQVIMFTKEQRQYVTRIYDELRKNPVKFDEEARGQFNSQLAATKGIVDPIGRNSGPATAKIEEIAFSLKEGEISEIIEIPTALMIIKNVKHHKPNGQVTFEQAKPHLAREATERQLEQLIPKKFAEISQEAHPLFVFSPPDITRAEMEDQTKRLLKTQQK